MISLLGNLGLYLMSFAHLWACPWTKVEESFNLQASHDLIYEDIYDVSTFDHWSFPGVVPRTFLGPLFISFPSLLITSFIDVHRTHVQLLVRATLGFSVISALIRFRSSIRRKFGSTTANFHLLITLSQFHLMYYSTRTLPNIFALTLVLLALSYWFDDDHYFKFIFISGFVILVFRFELILYLGTIVIMDLIVCRVSFSKTLIYGLSTLIFSLGLTIAVDSYFWRSFQSILWPEGEVIYYNVILNKSSNYGTSPFLWYFYSALPRALFATTPFVIIGSLRDKKMYLVGRSSTFLRLSLQFSSTQGVKEFTGHLLLNSGFTLAMSYISKQNYPGGVAMSQLHDLIPSHRTDINVYINNLAAQTGVSRFTQINEDSWKYDKREKTTDFSPYTHLIIEPKEYEESEYVGKFFFGELEL
ncbi:ALG12 [Lepeophtheirus salmonis]|uniref:Mannosyltransferase n=1 Tax=Lepeophtheirus salmonis TaxID=72036 RepID=A0A7R8D2X0_LEPSM|nr:ALG12 [Lepeophtheirus salmonis]CAF3009204.1 ALG12 [Lepeophtheirus salmonis]